MLKQITNISLLCYLVLVTFSNTGFAQGKVSIDTIIKNWERNGIPKEHLKDYHEYKEGQKRKKNLVKQQITKNDSPNLKTTSDICYNSGFELGDVSGWVRTPGVSTVQGVHVPVPDYDTMNKITNGTSQLAYDGSAFFPSLYTMYHSPNFPLDSISGYGYDYYVREHYIYKLKTNPINGGGYSFRLNDGTAMSKAVKLEYEFTATTSQPMFIYNYALVFSDGDHLDGEQAGFSVKVTDSIGNIIPISNTPLYISVNDAKHDSVLYGKSDKLADGSWDSIYYKKWEIDTLNLCNYIGRKLKISFEAIDCIYTAHFCYAYIDAQCYNKPVASIQNITCFDNTTLGFQGPIGFKAYQWIDPSGNIISPQQTGTQSFLDLNKYLQYCTTGNCTIQAGSVFTLNLTLISGCVITLTCTINSSPIKIGSSMLENTCVGGSNGSISVNATGGLGSYSYNWYPNNCSGMSISNSSSINNLLPGNYCLHVESGNCPAFDTTFTIKTFPVIIKDSTSQLPACLNNQFTINTNCNGSNYHWYSNNQLLINETNNQLIIDPLHFNNNYTFVYTNNSGCQDSIKYHLNVVAPKTFTALYCPKDEQAILIAPASFNPDTHEWFMDDNGNNISIGTKDTLDYSVSGLPGVFVVYYENGCKMIANKHIDKNPDNVFTPQKTSNVFTPNDDLVNDVFYPYENSNKERIAIEQDEYELLIYNRWGQLLFKSNTYSNGWNGKINNENASEGTYFWIATYLSNCVTNPKKITQKGTIQLLR